MSIDLFTVKQREHDAVDVTIAYADSPVREVNMRAAMTGNAYPVSGDTLARVRSFRA